LQEYTFDVAYCHHTLEHVPEPLEVVQSIFNQLVPGGHFFVTFADLPMTTGGINLVKSQEDRNVVLNWCMENFEVIKFWKKEFEYVLRKPI